MDEDHRPIRGMLGLPSISTLVVAPLPLSGSWNTTLASTTRGSAFNRAVSSW